MGSVVAKVIVPRPLDGPFSYLVPLELESKVKFGCHVKVPFRSSTIDGFVVELSDTDKEKVDYKLKPVQDVPFETPVFSKIDLDFYKWISEYYQLPLGEIFHSAFPKSVFKVLKRKSKEEKVDESQTVDAEFSLTEEQSNAFDRIKASIHGQKFKSFLLFGVTGSGKTEVYIRSAVEALEKGRSTLILVPEIALTPQLSKRFIDRLGDNVAILHSGLTDKQRRKQWWDILKGKKKVVVGARSALFAPLHNLGLIVVDEEHEPSYKQEDRLRYSARDLALVRARQHDASCVLGSATPSIETFHGAKNGKHELLALKKRPLERPMPEIQIVDLKHQEGSEEYEIFSDEMKQGLADTIINGEQAIVFVNRKGFSNFILCQECGHVPKCLNCSVSLTYYQSSGLLRCHYCGLKDSAPQKCGRCHSKDISRKGMGTELVEEELKKLFSKVRVERLDTDATSTGKKLNETLEEFRAGKIQILVGTQMVAKGHDFPNVTFIGVVLADLNLNLPDFRAAERTFQLLAQVAGRAGRGEKPGTVVLQTYIPDHYSIQCAARQDYEEFYNSEIEFRKQFSYPPFSRMAQVEFRNLKESAARSEAEQARQVLEVLKAKASPFSYLGPSAAAIARISNQYRWQILLRSEKNSTLNGIIKTLRKNGVRFIDVDPVTTL